MYSCSRRIFRRVFVIDYWSEMAVFSGTLVVLGSDLVVSRVVIVYVIKSLLRFGNEMGDKDSLIFVKSR